MGRDHVVSVMLIVNFDRGEKRIVPSHPFFTPCDHAAFTTPLDGVALDTGNECRGAEHITCCVGRNCPRSLRQIRYHPDGDEYKEGKKKPHPDPERPSDPKGPKKEAIWCTRGEHICENLKHCDPNYPDCEDDGYCGSNDLDCEANWEREKHKYDS